MAPRSLLALPPPQTLKPWLSNQVAQQSMLSMVAPSARWIMSAHLLQPVNLPHSDLLVIVITVAQVLSALTISMRSLLISRPIRQRYMVSNVELAASQIFSSKLIQKLGNIFQIASWAAQLTTLKSLVSLAQKTILMILPSTRLTVCCTGRPTKAAQVAPWSSSIKIMGRSNFQMVTLAL